MEKKTMPIRLQILALFLLGGLAQTEAQSPHTLDTSLALPGTPVLTLRQGGNVFAEGVAADWEGNVYFNEMDNNDRTMRLAVGQDTAKPWRQAKDDPNGMWVDIQNRLVICQTGAIVRVKTGAAFDNQTDTLYKYTSGGQAFNDVTGDSRDNLYFTNFRGRTVFFRNASGKIDTVLRNQNMPNGIEWDEERKRVYVNVNGDNKVVAYTVEADYSLTNPTDFATVQASDGIVLDERGNVYAVAFGDRVHVFSPQGAMLGEIVLGNQLTNLAFGGPDFKTLYMITQRGLYKLPMKVKGYKSGRYSVSARRAGLSPKANSRSRQFVLRRNQAVLILPDIPGSGPIQVNGRAESAPALR
jgi:gluconolactonase